MDNSEDISINDDYITEVISKVKNPLANILVESERDYRNMLEKKFETVHLINDRMKELLEDTDDRSTAVEIQLCYCFTYNDKYALWYQLTKKTVR